MDEGIREAGARPFVTGLLPPATGRRQSGESGPGPGARVHRTRSHGPADSLSRLCSARRLFADYVAVHPERYWIEAAD